MAPRAPSRVSETPGGPPCPFRPKLRVADHLSNSKEEELAARVSRSFLGNGRLPPRRKRRPLQRGGQAKNIDFWPFCTFFTRTRVAITAPRRPKRTKPMPKAARVLGNQPVAGFARRFGRLARQHVRCGAHMCLFQGQKSSLGARSYICWQRRFTASLWAQTKD